MNNQLQTEAFVAFVKSPSSVPSTSSLSTGIAFEPNRTIISSRTNSSVGLEKFFFEIVRKASPERQT